MVNIQEKENSGSAIPYGRDRKQKIAKKILYSVFCFLYSVFAVIPMSKHSEDPDPSGYRDYLKWAFSEAGNSTPIKSGPRQLVRLADIWRRQVFGFFQETKIIRNPK